MMPAAVAIIDEIENHQKKIALSRHRSYEIMPVQAEGNRLPCPDALRRKLSIGFSCLGLESDCGRGNRRQNGPNDHTHQSTGRVSEFFVP